MDVEYSRRACISCRRRRVKCDKSLPTCHRCQHRGQICPGYPPQQRFIDQTIKFDLNSSQGRRELGNHNSSKKSNLLPRRHELVVEATIEPASPDSNEASLRPEGAILSPLEAGLRWQRHDSDEDYFDLDVDTYYADINNACGFLAASEIDELGSSNWQTPYTYSPSGNHTVSSDELSGNHKEYSLDLEHELAPLIRVFVEALAPWMDMFSPCAFFVEDVSVCATEDILLQLAVAAIATKQAARVIASSEGRMLPRLYEPFLAVPSQKNQHEWFYQAARYYDQGISYLRIRLQQVSVAGTALSVATDLSEPQPVSPEASSTITGVGVDGHSISSPFYNVLSAVSIFSFCESLDDCLAMPSPHLGGFLALIGLHSPRIPSPQSAQSLSLASEAAERANFWYLMRREMLAAYTYRSQPPLDPEDQAIWVAAGLPAALFSSFGCEVWKSQLDEYNTANRDYRHKTMAYILIWLCTKVVKYVADLSTQPISHPSNQSTPSSSIHTISNEAERIVSRGPEVQWRILRNQVRWWYDNRPQLFKTYASHESNVTNPNTPEGKTVTVKSFFTTPTGAATVQLYHFAQLLLLLNLPMSLLSTNSTHAVRLQTLKNNTLEIEVHSRAICSIALGSSSGFITQRQLSHPLQLAGAFFSEPKDREIILQTLTDAAMETCSPVDDVVKNLISHWQHDDQIRNV